MKILRVITAATLAATFSYAAYAEDVENKASKIHVAAAAPTALAEGEVRKVDKEAGKVTIKHGPLKNLDMPAMTMVFQVKDKAMLDNLKAGDKINFTADHVNGTYTVTTIEPGK